MLCMKECNNPDSLWQQEQYKLCPKSARSLHIVNRQRCTVVNRKLWILSLWSREGTLPFYLLIYFCCMLDHKEPLLNPLSFLARFEVPHFNWMFVSRLSCEFTRKLRFTEPLSGTVRLPAAASQWHRMHAEEWNNTMKCLWGAQIQLWAERSLAWSCWAGGSESPGRWANLVFYLSDLWQQSSYIPGWGWKLSHPKGEVLLVRIPHSRCNILAQVITAVQKSGAMPTLGRCLPKRRKKGESSDLHRKQYVSLVLMELFSIRCLRA